MWNLRLILRGLARSPLFSGAGIVSLALGIGANTAIFSLLHQALLRTLPVPRPGELVYLHSPGPWQGRMSTDEPNGPSFSYPLFRELQKTQAPFVGIAGARSQLASVSDGSRTSYDIARLVSGNYFQVLGVAPVLGRLFTEDDDRSHGGHPVAVLSHAYWSSRFAANADALSRTISVNGLRFAIIGVTPPGFLGERTGEPPDFYIPISMKKAVTPDWDSFEDRQYGWVTLFARRKPGVSLERSEAEINAAYRAQLEQDERLLRQPTADFLRRFRARRMVLSPGEYGRGGLRERLRDPLVLLIGIAAMVLGIACANVANLQLARAAGRTREVAVRLAIGASRGQLVRQFLGESLVLALGGGVLGLAIAWGTLRAVVASLPAFSGMDGVFAAGLDWRALLFSAGLSMLAGAVFGLYPALRASKPDLVASIKQESGQVSAGGSADVFRKALVTAQAAIAVALLISGGLFAKTLVALASKDLGLRTDHLAVFNILPKFNRYSDQSVADLHGRITDRLKALPGVTMVSSAQLPAVGGSKGGGTISVPGFAARNEEEMRVNLNMVGADYFRTVGTPVMKGREFTAGDTLATTRVAIVNQTFAKRYYGEGNPIGRRFSQQSGEPVEIVGVVRDANYSQMRETPLPVYFTPLRQNETWFQLYFYVRTSTPPEQFLALIPREVAALDPDLPVRYLKTMETQVDENLFQERMLSALAGAFAGLATVLAALGLYGVLAYNIARRTREIGVRMAIGASAGSVGALVAREVAWVVGMGTAVGVAVAAAGGTLVESLLYGMKAWDVGVYGGAVGILWVVAAIAAYGPVRRAAGVDPMVALRHE